MNGLPQPKKTDRDHREYLIRNYGDSTVLHAEVTALVGMCSLAGIFTTREFLEVVEGICKRIDTRRRQEANLDEDRG